MPITSCNYTILYGHYELATLLEHWSCYFHSFQTLRITLSVLKAEKDHLGHSPHLIMPRFCMQWHYSRRSSWYLITRLKKNVRHNPSKILKPSAIGYWITSWYIIDWYLSCCISYISAIFSWPVWCSKVLAKWPIPRVSRPRMANTQVAGSRDGSLPRKRQGRQQRGSNGAVTTKAQDMENGWKWQDQGALDCKLITCKGSSKNKIKKMGKRMQKVVVGWLLAYGSSSNIAFESRRSTAINDKRFAGW